MQITVRGKHNHVSESLQKFAVEKFEHLGRYLSTITEIDIELYEDGQPKRSRGHVAHVTVSTTGPRFRAKADTEDIRLSINVAFERLERRIKDFKRTRSGRPAHSRPRVESADKSKRTSSVEMAEED